MTTSQRHAEISQEFLRHSRDELAAGDLLQASGKGHQLMPSGVCDRLAARVSG